MTSPAARIGARARRIGIAITAATLLAGLVSAATAAAITATGGDITATWSGRIDWTDVYDPNHPAIILTTAGDNWTYSITVRSTASSPASTSASPRTRPRRRHRARRWRA